jgi:SAM-dependent methyltransferase
MIEKEFSHVQNVPLYMRRVCEYLSKLPKGRLLDIPAGNGYIVNYSRRLGLEATGADINSQEVDFVNCNMEKSLPFNDAHFDVVTCLEGIEHVINQDLLFSELARITKPDGILILSTPNISNFYSRLKFLFTGTFGQFWPHEMRSSTNAAVDLGHIHPISPQFISYAMHVRGLELEGVIRDRLKRLIYFPIFLLCLPWMIYATFRMLGYMRRVPQAFTPGIKYSRILLGFDLMWSRSAVLIFKKSKNLSIN